MHSSVTRSMQTIRQTFTKIGFLSERRDVLAIDCRGQVASDLIKETLSHHKPCMICRFGSGELETVLRHLDVSNDNDFSSKLRQYFANEIGPFWWDTGIKKRMSISGLFPANEELLARFAQRMIHDIELIDILGSWCAGEARLQHYFPSSKVIHLQDLEPYYHKNPWSEVLENKRVLVIHPFEDSIKRQYTKRHLLFKNQNTLPKFELQTFKAVQSIAGVKVNFKDWFEALDYMCEQISALEFDIAIVGAGPYGLPLSAHIKRMGRKAVHLGGATQILFGIRGKRWDENPFFQNLYNEHWIRPSATEVPVNFKAVEGGCYW